MAGRLGVNRKRASRFDTLPAPAAGLIDALRAAIGEPGRVRDRASDRLAFAADASHFLLTPEVVVTPTSANEVARLLQAASSQQISLTFRSGGTSLSGQASTDGMLVDTRRHFRDIEVLDGGTRVRVQPGATVRQVNARLAAHGRKLGPDPASESACTIGGVIANNSSGMACGVEYNSYQTIESVVVVLPSGTTIDTGASDADERLRVQEPALYEGLLVLRDRVRLNPASVRTIRQQFAMKNTMGYSLNTFLDHDDPVAMLAHLIIGSEGTLAFIAEATFRTLPLLPHATTGLLVFDDLRAATRSLPALLETGPATVELLDAVSLRVAQQDPQAGETLRQISVADHAALLVEYQARSAEELTDYHMSASKIVAQLRLSTAVAFTDDPRSRSRLWHVRKNLYAAVAGSRAIGTTALLEDIVVPVPALLATCEQLVDLFAKHHYDESVIFGHAKDGNLHFMLTEHFDQPDGLARYQRFTDDMVDLVLGHNGSLKAEHGTGRMMTPYLRRQYGDELYAVMRELKALFDPTGLLSRRVVLDDDPTAHLKHLKKTPAVDPEVDRCVECGYCEPVCPSRDLTTTPRQRIVLRRAWATAKAAGDLALAAQLEVDYTYDAVDTCAADGMCQTACPVLINTGDLVKRLRAETRGRFEQAAWRLAASHWSATTRTAAAALDAAAVLPDALMAGGSRAIRRIGGAERIPLWSADLPRGGHPRPAPAASQPEAVFFPSCLSSMFAPATTGLGVSKAFVQLCQRAGVNLTTPNHLANLCCGTPWKSKGLRAGYAAIRNRVLPELIAATRLGQLPIVCDAASCTEGLTQLLKSTTTDSDDATLHVIDAVQYVAEHLLPRLTINDRLPSIAIHPTCSSTRLDTNDALLTLARAIAKDVTIPDDSACCGFAGDRGLLHPELTAAATAPETAVLNSRDYATYASCNRTCEIGMTRATGHNYQHLIELVELVTRLHS